MTALVQATRCPTWCTEDRLDIDGSTFAFHAHRITTGCQETRIDIVEEPGLPAFIDVEVQGGNMWTADDAIKLIGALVQAIWILDPNYEHPAEVDKSGLWQAVGNTVRRHMASVRLSQTDLALPLGISQPEFSIISRGQGVRTFTLTELDAIAEIIGCTLTELVEDIEAAR